MTMPPIDRRALLAACMLVLATGCAESMRDWRRGEVGKALKYVVRDKPTAAVDLGAITRFAWDEFYAFPARTAPREVCRKLALSRADCDAKIAVTSIAEDEMLLVFRDKGRVAHVELHGVENGDFTNASRLSPLSREQAVFLVIGGRRRPSGTEIRDMKPRFVEEQEQALRASGSGSGPAFEGRAILWPVQPRAADGVGVPATPAQAEPPPDR